MVNDQLPMVNENQVEPTQTVSPYSVFTELDLITETAFERHFLSSAQSTESVLEIKGRAEVDITIS